MILSVSRRTDIPNYYADWFFNRMKEGHLYVRNPMNAHQISKISLSPEVIDCIVFWTKNPEPMLARLEELERYPFYFQFTLTGYGNDIECNVPDKKKYIIPVFQELSQKIGAEKVIWRYDPVIFTDKYTPAYHLKAFEQIAGALQGYTRKCVISFVDIYHKNQKNLKELNSYYRKQKTASYNRISGTKTVPFIENCAAISDKLYYLPDSELTTFGRQMAQIAGSNGMKLASCAEKIDLSACGIEHNCCIDKELIEEIIGCRIQAGKDKNQRKECGCIESIEVGTYNTCKNGCRYCYANESLESVLKNCQQYDADSLLLCGQVTENDKITERKMKSLKEKQLTIWDL